MPVSYHYRYMHTHTSTYQGTQLVNLNGMQPILKRYRVEFWTTGHKEKCSNAPTMARRRRRRLQASEHKWNIKWTKYKWKEASRSPLDAVMFQMLSYCADIWAKSVGSSVTVFHDVRALITGKYRIKSLFTCCIFISKALVSYGKSRCSDYYNLYL